MKEETIYICETCGKRMKNQYDMKLHEAAHFDNTPEQYHKRMELQNEVGQAAIAYSSAVKRLADFEKDNINFTEDDDE